MIRRNILTSVSIIGLLVLLLARFGTVGWQRLLLNTNSADGDQGAYLQLGLDLQSTGMLTDGTRNPLYPALLALFAERDWLYFSQAKLLSLFFGALTIVSLYWIGQKRFGRGVGLLAATLLSVNMEFIIHSSSVLAESLLTLLLLLTWFAMGQAWQTKTNQHPFEYALDWKDELIRHRWWFLAGLGAGLTYLAKGTGQLVALCFVIIIILLAGLKDRRDASQVGLYDWARLLFKRHYKSLAIFIICYSLMALPLWGYNAAVFGNPFYNLATTHQLWMDAWEENFVSDPSQLPTMTSYWQTHTPADAINRLTIGLTDMPFFVLKTLWPTRTQLVDQFYFSERWNWLIGVMFLLGLLCYQPLLRFAQRYPFELLFTAGLTALFYVLFSWYLVIVPIPIRFILPLLPIWLLFIAVVIIQGTHYLTGRLPLFWRVFSRTTLGLTGLTLFGLWFSLTVWLGGLPFERNSIQADAEFNQNRAETLAWLVAGQAKPTVPILWGPSQSMPLWRYSDQLTLTRFPVDTTTPEKLNQLLARHQPKYIILDQDTVERRPDAAQLLSLSNVTDGQLSFAAPPEGLAVAYLSPSYPCRWCVFQQITAYPLAGSTDYRFAEAIQLVGYELSTKQAERWVLTLHWQSLQPVSKNFTAFVQLLGAEGQLYAQRDRQPLHGHLPTAYWQPGQAFVDKILLDLSQPWSAPSATLLVGLYDLETGQRLAVTDAQGQPQADQAVRLQVAR